MNLSELAYWSTEEMHALKGDKRTGLYDVILGRWLEVLAYQAAFVRE